MKHLPHGRKDADEYSHHQTQVTAAATAGFQSLQSFFQKDITFHQSFDHAQQVYCIPYPMQPSPIYILKHRKCLVCGVCCEGLP